MELLRESHTSKLTINFFTIPNFSSKRYTLWYTRGSGHNGPVVNGIEQTVGGHYTASMGQPEYHDGAWTAVCDLSKAYPEAAGISKLIRTIAVTDTQVTIQDELAAKDKTESEINLIVLGKPEQRSDGIAFEQVKLQWKDLSLVSIELQEESFNEWPDALYRIVLRSNSPRYQLIVSLD